MLVSPMHDGVATTWFSPGFWGERATPVASGGRGAAWFIDTEPTDLVLRHYRRGGLVARLAEKTYFFIGFRKARSLAEFQLLEKLCSLGLPVPEPIAAIAWRCGIFWYRAAIIVKRIPGAVTFADSSRLGDKELWHKLGRVIRRFHDEGLDHADLNCDNILVAGDRIYLIDFDRCRLDAKAGNRVGVAWRQSNLNRLRRSVEKRCSGLSKQQRQDHWQSLLQSYNQDF